MISFIKGGALAVGFATITSVGAIAVNSEAANSAIMTAVYGEHPEASSIMKDDVKINSKQRASTTTRYLGADADGDGVYRIKSYARNKYWEKGNTFNIYTEFLGKDGDILWIHHERLGVNNRDSNHRTKTVTVPEAVSRQVVAVNVSANNKGNTGRILKDGRDTVKGGILKGIEKGISNLVASTISPAKS